MNTRTKQKSLKKCRLDRPGIMKVKWTVLDNGTCSCEDDFV